MNPENVPEPEREGQEPSPHEECDRKLGELLSRLEERERRYKYLYADFDNFKKRAAQEQDQLVRSAWKRVAVELLDVVDTLERALLYAGEGVDPEFRSGIELTLKQLFGTLEKYGVTRMDVLGLPFDPHLHEAVAYSPSGEEKGKIVSVDRPGYLLQGQVLRAPSVVVSSGAAEQKESKTA